MRTGEGAHGGAIFSSGTAMASSAAALVGKEREKEMERMRLGFSQLTAATGFCSRDLTGRPSD
jgi:hypothetical protein